jgi:cytochrome c6
MAVAVFALGNALIAGCGGGSKSEQTPSTSTTTTPSGGTQAAAPSTSSTASATVDGAAIYAEKCTVCHGPNGKGDGPGGAALNPKPRDHTDGKYMNSRTNEQLLEVIHNGKGNMPAWKGVLTEDQMKAVLKHVRGLAVPPYTGPMPS